jgi:hypothetical protein
LFTLLPAAQCRHAAPRAATQFFLHRSGSMVGGTLTTAKAILLLEATDRGMSAQDLDLALTSYARLQAEIARRALGCYRTRTKSAAIPPALAANS